MGPLAEIVTAPPRTFKTARLHARPPHPDDVDDVFNAYASDPAATRYLAWKPYTAKAPLRDFLQARATAWQIPDGHFAYLLCPRDTGRPIGSIAAFVESSKVMFGYVLGSAYWGNGYATEALEYLVHWAMATAALERAWAYCAVDNVASIRVMEKAGLRREALMPQWQVFPNLGSELRDCVFYARGK